MTKNIGPMNSEMPPFGEVTLNGKQIVHHMDAPEFPSREKAHDVCMSHIKDGRMGDMLDEFWLTGCHFPEEDEPAVIRTAFVCDGPSMFKMCRLRLLQAKLDGDVITEGKYTD